MKAFNMRLTVFVLGAVTAIPLLTACKEDGPATGGVTAEDGQPASGGESLKPLVGGSNYSSDAARYSLSFPESWTTTPGDHGAVTGVSKPEEGATVGASVTVFPGSLPSPMSAADLMARYLAGMKSDGFQKTEEHHGKVNGRDAVWVVVDINSNDVLRRGMVLGTTEGNTAYILTCSTLPEMFAAVRPTFEGVLGTFKVTR
jgi:hypothetical protein